jgi:hypothetical protein
MVEQRPPVRIAINVMRARLTVVGFNLTVITFQLAQIRRLPGGVQLPNVNAPIHLVSDTALLMGLGFSVIAMVGFIASSAFDRDGTCTHWSLLAGDLFMYLGLAYSVAGFFGPLVRLLDPSTLDAANQMAELTTVHGAVLIVGGGAWFAATYIGPAVSLLRSPFDWRITAALGIAYLLLLICLAHVGAQAVRLAADRAGKDDSATANLLHELVQPLRW